MAIVIAVPSTRRSTTSTACPPLMIGIGTLAGVVASRYWALTTFRPLRRAACIAAGDSIAHVRLPAQHRELGRLAAALNTIAFPSASRAAERTRSGIPPIRLRPPHSWRAVTSTFASYRRETSRRDMAWMSRASTCPVAVDSSCCRPPRRNRPNRCRHAQGRQREEGRRCRCCHCWTNIQLRIGLAVRTHGRCRDPRIPAWVIVNLTGA